MSEMALTTAGCRERQRRLREVMERRGVELAIITQREPIEWLAGFYIAPYFQPAAALDRDGKLTVVAPRKRAPQAAAAEQGGPVDVLVEYESASHSTMRNDQRLQSTEALLKALGSRAGAKTIGVEFSTYGVHLSSRLSGKAVDLEPDLFALRRRKSADELAAMKIATEATSAMYARARQLLQPGVNELDVFNELQAVAVRMFRERLTDTGNDYQANARGGGPRHRVAQAGELYILDLGPAYRGYYADNCRTFAVDGQPTREQREAWARIAAVFDIIMQEVRPGVSCQAVYEQCHRWLNDQPHGKFDHHLGHGLGLFPHEAPHLNPNWDDVFEVGDVFTVEPGIYGDVLRAGIRLENNYHVTERGVELLTTYPLDL